MNLFELYTPEELREMRDSLPLRGMVKIEKAVPCSYSFVQKVLGGAEDLAVTDKVRGVIREAKKLIRQEIKKNENLKAA